MLAPHIQKRDMRPVLVLLRYAAPFMAYIVLPLILMIHHVMVKRRNAQQGMPVAGIYACMPTSPSGWACIYLAQPFAESVGSRVLVWRNDGPCVEVCARMYARVSDCVRVRTHACALLWHVCVCARVCVHAHMSVRFHGMCACVSVTVCVPVCL